METLITLTVLQTLVFTGYILFLLHKFKQPLPSISQSWYQLKPYNQQYLFTWFIGLLGLFTLMQGGLLFLLSGIFLLFVGITTEFKKTFTLEDEIHYGGAVLGILLSLLGLWHWGLIWPSLIMVLWLGVCVVWNVKNFTWWVEIGAFISIISGMFWRALEYGGVV